MSDEHATRDRAPSMRAVDLALPRPRPERLSLPGERVRVEPLDPARHGPDLFRLGHDGSAAAEQSWAYLPYGPFASESEHRSWLEIQAASEDPLFFAIVDGDGPRGRRRDADVDRARARRDRDRPHLALARPAADPGRHRGAGAADALRDGRPRLPPPGVEVQRRQRRLPPGRRAPRLPLRGRLLQPPGLQGPQPRHRVVLDPRRGVAGGERRLRDLARRGQLRRPTACSGSA